MYPVTPLQTFVLSFLVSFIFFTAVAVFVCYHMGFFKTKRRIKRKLSSSSVIEMDHSYIRVLQKEVS